ncbi:MAG: RNA polymerase sigma-70 factor [Bacteroides sp.]|jgi:RNA polymerase sigma-70 factor (ECF subfamily)|nr:RNA polymerase sigma-70 factor [Bacteroides sp.]
MNKGDFQDIFNTYFEAIRRFVYYKTSDEQVAEDIAEDVFMQLWERRDRLELLNIKALLYKMASDNVVSYYRKQDVRLSFAENMRPDESASLSPQEELQFEELKARYAAVLEEMPDGQREVFLMNREESLKYHEIAERLNLSVKAIEKRMNAALSLLRKKLL